MAPSERMALLASAEPNSTHHHHHPGHVRGQRSQSMVMMPPGGVGGSGAAYGGAYAYGSENPTGTTSYGSSVSQVSYMLGMEDYATTTSVSQSQTEWNTPYQHPLPAPALGPFSGMPGLDVAGAYATMAGVVAKTSPKTASGDSSSSASAVTSPRGNGAGAGNGNGAGNGGSKAAFPVATKVSTDFGSPVSSAAGGGPGAPVAPATPNGAAAAISPVSLARRPPTLDYTKLGLGLGPLPAAALALIKPAAPGTAGAASGGNGVTLMSASALRPMGAGASPCWSASSNGSSSGYSSNSSKRRTFPLLSRGHIAEESSADFMSGMLQSLVLQQSSHAASSSAQQGNNNHDGGEGGGGGGGSGGAGAADGAGRDLIVHEPEQSMDSAAPSSTSTPQRGAVSASGSSQRSIYRPGSRRSGAASRGKDPFSPTDSPLRLLFERSPSPDRSPLQGHLHLRSNRHSGGGASSGHASTSSSSSRRRCSETALHHADSSSRFQARPAPLDEDTRIRPMQARRRALQTELDAAAIAQAVAAAAASAATAGHQHESTPHAAAPHGEDATLTRPEVHALFQAHPLAAARRGGRGARVAAVAHFRRVVHFDRCSRCNGHHRQR